MKDECKEDLWAVQNLHQVGCKLLTIHFLTFTLVVPR